MKKQRVGIFIGMLLVPGLISCEQEGESASGKISPSNLVPDVTSDDATSSAAEKDTKQTEKEEGPFGIVTASWLGLDIKGGIALSELQLKVKNEIDVPVTVDAELVCDAFIDKTSSKMMFPMVQTIFPGKEAIFTLPVNAMPLQVISGAGAFNAKVHAVIEVGGETLERAVHATQFLYRHNSEYKTIDVFGVNALANGNGILMDPATSKTEVLGRSLNEDGIATDVLGQAAKKSVIGADGMNYGTVDGVSIEFEAE